MLKLLFGTRNPSGKTVCDKLETTSNRANKRIIISLFLHTFNRVVFMGVRDQRVNVLSGFVLQFCQKTFDSS